MNPYAPPEDVDCVTHELLLRRVALSALWTLGAASLLIVFVVAWVVAPSAIPAVAGAVAVGFGFGQLVKIT